MIHHSPNRRREGRGFTLVELLVSITIVVVLASIAVVFAGRSKRKANAASTLGALRQIGIAAHSWMGDNHDRYPPCWDNTEGRNRSYAQVLGEYLYNDDNFRGVDSIFIGPNARLPVKSGKWAHPITFSMNRAVCRDITQSDGVVPQLVRVTQVERPSDVILMADGCQNPSNRGQSNASAYRIAWAVKLTGPRSQFSEPIPEGPDEDSSAGDGWFRYPDGSCNALMCDGSARSFLKGTITKGNMWIDKAN